MCFSPARFDGLVAETDVTSNVCMLLGDTRRFDVFSLR